MIPYLPGQPKLEIVKTPVVNLDLHSQLEDILNAVWGAEENWRFDDRLDLALKQRRAADAA